MILYENCNFFKLDVLDMKRGDIYIYRYIIYLFYENRYQFNYFVRIDDTVDKIYTCLMLFLKLFNKHKVPHVVVTSLKSNYNIMIKWLGYGINTQIYSFQNRNADVIIEGCDDALRFD